MGQRRDFHGTNCIVRRAPPCEIPFVGTGVKLAEQLSLLVLSVHVRRFLTRSMSRRRLSRCGPPMPSVKPIKEHYHATRKTARDPAEPADSLASLGSGPWSGNVPRRNRRDA